MQNERIQSIERQMKQADLSPLLRHAVSEMISGNRLLEEFAEKPSLSPDKQPLIEPACRLMYLSSFQLFLESLHDIPDTLVYVVADLCRDTARLIQEVLKKHHIISAASTKYINALQMRANTLIQRHFGEQEELPRIRL